MDELTLKKMQELLTQINMEIQGLNLPATENNINLVSEALWRLKVIFNTISHELIERNKEKKEEKKDGKGDRTKPDV